jgi:methylaspartate ammonia-lyase
MPKHLAGSREEQFLEQLIAIKAQIKSEAEKIWNGCFKVHQMIAVASDDDKRRVFSEQFEIWRNRLIKLQEKLIGDRLLPLVVEYGIAENEQMWLLKACQEAWNPVAAGY